MSLCSSRLKSHWFLFSNAPKVNLFQRTLQLCIFRFDAFSFLFLIFVFCCWKSCHVVDAYHFWKKEKKFNFYISIGVHSASWRRSTVLAAAGVPESLTVHPVAGFSPALVHVSKTIKSWLWPCSIPSKHDMDPLTMHPVQDPTVHLKLLTSSTSWFHWGCVECKKKII